MPGYEVVDAFGDVVAHYVYTVKGLHDACEYAKNREQRDLYWEIRNPANVDVDNSSGLNAAEKEYLEIVWGLV